MKNTIRLLASLLCFAMLIPFASCNEGGSGKATDAPTDAPTSPEDAPAPATDVPTEPETEAQPVPEPQPDQGSGSYGFDFGPFGGEDMEDLFRYFFGG